VRETVTREFCHEQAIFFINHYYRLYRDCLFVIPKKSSGIYLASRSIHSFIYSFIRSFIYSVIHFPNYRTSADYTRKYWVERTVTGGMSRRHHDATAASNNQNSGPQTLVHGHLPYSSESEAASSSRSASMTDWRAFDSSILGVLFFFGLVAGGLRVPPLPLVLLKSVMVVDCFLQSCGEWRVQLSCLGHQW